MALGEVKLAVGGYNTESVIADGGKAWHGVIFLILLCCPSASGYASARGWGWVFVRLLVSVIPTFARGIKWIIIFLLIPYKGFFCGF